MLIFGAIGLVLAVKKKEPLRRRNTIVVGIAVLVMINGYALFVGSLGGWSYGIRYLIPVIPIFLFFIPVVLKKVKKAIFVCVLVISTAFALIGMYNPCPPVYEPEIEPHPVASMVKNPIGGYFSAWAREYLGDTAFTKFVASGFIDPNEEKQNQYEQSIGYFEQATKINPGHAAAHNNWGIALASIEKLDQGVKHFQIAVRLQPDNQSCQHNLSRAQALMKRKK